MRELKQLTVGWLREPKYALGQKVWTNDGNGIDETEVMYHIVKMAECEDDGAKVTYAVIQRYVLRQFNVDSDDTYWGEDEIYPSRDEAERLTTKVPVKFSQDDWMAAIGLNSKSDRIHYDEEAELGPCCANISEIRDMLYKCCKDGGLITRDVEALQRMLDNHEPATKSMCPTLYKILKKIGVEWKEAKP
jgi:hypothetical protein